MLPVVYACIAAIALKSAEREKFTCMVWFKIYRAHSLPYSTDGYERCSLVSDCLFDTQMTYVPYTPLNIYYKSTLVHRTFINIIWWSVASKLSNQRSILYILDSMGTILSLLCNKSWVVCHHCHGIL